jgi:hypothetical protein
VVKRFCVILAADIASTIYPADVELAAIELELISSAATGVEAPAAA